MIYKHAFWRFFGGFGIFLISMMSNDASSIDAEIYERLDRIRDEKKQQLFDYLKQIRANVDAVKQDDVISDFFHIKQSYYHLQKKFPPPEDVKKKIESLKKRILDHYLFHYRQFYDIMFINKNGDVFFTIRKQGDYHKNLFESELNGTSLAKQLKENPLKTFIDYQYYAVSNEPSSFFIVPVLKNGELSGWIALQCAINKINNMFVQENRLGDTGEIFLVNRYHRMLTDSRFFADSSILRQQLSADNISAKFREKSGHKSVVDYRGFQVLSSFEVCRIADCDWLLIAKIDYDEVLTEYFKRNKDELLPRLLDAIEKDQAKASTLEIPKGRRVEVDMDEYRRVHNGELLHTWGVSTCTALIVSYPGRFAYMAHVSDLDKSYGGKTTDLIEHVMSHIDNFDIHRYECRWLQVTVVARHLKSLGNIINKLLDKGLFLSQIKFVYDPEAVYGEVTHDYKHDATFVRWLMNRETEEEKTQSSHDVRSFGEITKTILVEN